MFTIYYFLYQSMRDLCWKFIAQIYNFYRCRSRHVCACVKEFKFLYFWFHLFFRRVVREASSAPSKTHVRIYNACSSFIAQQHKSCVHKKGSWSQRLGCYCCSYWNFYLPIAEEDHNVDLPNRSHTLRGQLFWLNRVHLQRQINKSQN